ncbi:MAG TPA: DUF6659 family protein [Candidatus Nitrosotalea sp.]|nr:DUF6659 family protein [Candidatus Nitrosotalea sp.]
MESGLESIPNFGRRLPSHETLEYICGMILDLDPNIRFVGIINNKGKLLTGQTKKGILVFATPKDQEMLLMETALGMRMRKEHDSHLGSVKFTISYSDKIMLTFPLGDELLCISAEKKINFMTVSFLILKFLEANLDAIMEKDGGK